MSEPEAAALLVAALLLGIGGLAVVVLLLVRDTGSSRDARRFLSPSEVCFRMHEQGCSYCEDLSCGDNTSPASRLLRAARGLDILCEGGYPKLRGEWKMLEDAIHECEGKRPDA
jgi:hypothetical protein